MKTTRANTFIEVNCQCPYCDAYLDVLDDVRESLEDDHRATNCDVEVKCSDCKEAFIVTDIDF